MSVAHVAHDAFARGAYHRESQPETGYVCAWCGRAPKVLFTYSWEPDDKACPHLSPKTTSPVFCNLSCFRGYHL